MRLNETTMDALLFKCYNNSVTLNPKFPIAEKMGGNLKFRATKPIIGGNEWKIVIDGNIADYVDYLEFGTYPHLIPNAFGRGITVLHPGSQKHKGFIERGMFDIMLRTVVRELKGQRVSIM